SVTEAPAVRTFGGMKGQDRNVGTHTPRDPSTELNAIHLLHNDKRITPAAVKKILETNPRNFYGLHDGRDCAYSGVHWLVDIDNQGASRGKRGHLNLKDAFRPRTVGITAPGVDRVV